MGDLKVSEILKEGNSYEIITKYKEIPIKVRMKLKWISDEDNLAGFDWKLVSYKKAFSTLDPVYVKLSEDKYLRSQVFSNLGKELVLSIEEITSPPEFIKRRFVRVEPHEKKPVVVIFNINNKKIKVNAKDISETGVGILLDRKKDREIIKFLEEELKKLKTGEFLECEIEINLPEMGNVRGKGKLKNVIDFENGVYTRLGFEASFPKEDIYKIRKYVLERQKEIIQSLRMLE